MMMTSSPSFQLTGVETLQLSAGYSVSTPVNWKDGEDVIIMPSVSDDDAKGKFPKGWKALKPTCA